MAEWIKVGDGEDAYEVTLKQGWNMARYEDGKLHCLFCGRIAKMFDPAHMDEACLKSPKASVAS